MYTNEGRVAKITSYDAATGGNVVNEIEYTYDDSQWNGLTKSEQAHNIGGHIGGQGGNRY